MHHVVPAWRAAARGEGSSSRGLRGLGMKATLIEKGGRGTVRPRRARRSCTHRTRSPLGKDESSSVGSLRSGIDEGVGKSGWTWHWVSEKNGLAGNRIKRFPAIGRRRDRIGHERHSGTGRACGGASGSVSLSARLCKEWTRTRRRKKLLELGLAGATRGNPLMRRCSRRD